MQKPARQHPAAGAALAEDLVLRSLRSCLAVRSSPGSRRSRRLPPGCCRPSLRTRREARILPIVGMSSDRLFLDRVGRHQSPSLLHRQDQTNTHPPKPGPKDDISLLKIRAADRIRKRIARRPITLRGARRHGGPTFPAFSPTVLSAGRDPAGRSSLRPGPGTFALSTGACSR